MKQKSIYLCARYYAKPKQPKMTRIAGYMSDKDNVAWDEKVDFTLGLKDKDLLASKIVLNITEQKVTRNAFGTDKGFMELFEYFYNANPKQISNALQQFGMTIGKTNESIQENVREEAEASKGSEPAASAESAITS